MKLSGLMLALVATSAWAQSSLPTPGLDRLVLVPGSGPVVGGDAATLEQGRFRIALAGHYERNPLMVTATGPDGHQRFEVIGHRVQTHLLVAVGVLDWLDIQAQAALTVYQGGQALTGVGLSQPDSFGLGSPVLGLRARILSQKSGPFDLSFQVGVALPLGSAGALTGGRFSVFPSLHIGRSFGLLHLAGSVGGAIEARRAVGDSFVGGGVEVNALLGVGDGVRGELISRNFFSLAGAPATAELLVGGRILSVPWVDFFLHGGPGFGDAPGAPAFRIIGGIGVGNAYGTRPSAVDLCALPEHTPEQCPDLDDDRDGVRNGVDRCPLEPEDSDGFADEDGCPDPDNDQDGVEDAQDRCPDVAGVAAFDGCPVPDADHDGVLDADDRCPNEPGPVERLGCPFRDTDSDGVEDEQDACPLEAGPVELKGCPARDADGDGVPDHLDNCPAEKGVTENQGCPKKKKQLVVITAERLVIKDKVYFATGKSTILSRSFPLLNQVADVINGHAEIQRVVVEGHTDSVGEEAYNQQLSQRRAQSVATYLNRRLSSSRATAVMDYLIKRGVARERLAARGYGPDRPAATNTTAAGREQNRRVEFTLPQNGSDEGGGTP